jgi:hypothetical protein
MDDSSDIFIKHTPLKKIQMNEDYAPKDEQSQLGKVG